jgi:acetate CoA/acetoacetate CoA-transferase beta subunit
MDAKERIARRVACEIKTGMLVNLGIGLPSMVANFVPASLGVFFQAENGVIGLGARPPEGMEDPHLTDAGGGFVSAVPGAASIDSAMSFGLIRGGHLDMTVLGGLQVDELGHLANWKVPGKMVKGMGGAIAIGPILQGIARPVNDLSRGCSVQDIYRMIAITANQAIGAKKK